MPQTRHNQSSSKILSSSSKAMSRHAVDMMLDASSSENEDDDKKPSPLKSRLSLGKKSVSWIPPRNTSPLPVRTTTEPAESSSTPLAPALNPNDTPVKKMTRCRSEIISLVDGNAPPLPYNIKSKKRVARRIQSIHHIVEHETAEERRVQAQMQSLSIQTDDDLTTISGGSGSATDSQRRPSLASSDAGDVSLHSTTTAATVRTRVKYVPYRLQESAPDLTSHLSRPLSVREQTRIATLLSAQEAQFGFNMFDTLIPGDNDEIKRLTQLGYRYEDAALMIFEKRYVNKSDEPLSAYYAPRSQSAPTSPNISYDYSIGSNAADAPNYSADYAYSPGVYYQPASMHQTQSFSGASSVRSGYTSGYASTLPSPPAPGYYQTGYPIAYSPYAASYATPIPAPLSPPPAHVSTGLPPKSPKHSVVMSGRKTVGSGGSLAGRSQSSTSTNTSNSSNNQSLQLSSSSSSSKRNTSSKQIVVSDVTV